MEICHVGYPGNVFILLAFLFLLDAALFAWGEYRQRRQS